MRVLLADDAAVARSILTRLVAEAGHEVVGFAEDAPGALDACAALRPDAVVVDGRLPPDGALPLVARLRALDGELRVLVTASFDELDLARSASAGGATVLERPFVRSKIEAALVAPARTR